MSRTVNWLGAAAAVLYIVFIYILLYLQGLAADQNPGGENRIDGTLWLLAIGLVVIAAGTVAVSRMVGRRSH